MHSCPEKEFYSLGFYRVLQLGGRALQKKELSQAKETAVTKIYRVVGGSGIRIRGGCGHAVQPKQGVSRLLRSVECSVSISLTGTHTGHPSWWVHLGPKIWVSPVVPRAKVRWHSFSPLDKPLFLTDHATQKPLPLQNLLHLTWCRF